MHVIEYFRGIAVVSLLAAGLTACGENSTGPETLATQRNPSVTTGPANGTLVVAGGNIKDAEIIERFIKLAGGPGARIVVVPTAAEGDVDNLDWDYLEPSPV